MLKKLRILLRLSFYELLMLDFIPGRATVNEYVTLTKKLMNPRFANQVNGILRSYLRAKDIPYPEVPFERLSMQFSFPKWMIKRWLGFWDQDEVEQFCMATNKVPELNIRINAEKTSSSELKAQLDEQQIAWKENPSNINCLLIKDSQALLSGPWIEQGDFSVQDTSASLPVQLFSFRKDDLVLDMCAAPGGKYTQILEIAGRQITAIAMDQDISRLKVVKKNTDRLGLSGGKFVVADGRNLPFRKRFSKILLDAPCSGLGVIRKHPDIKWRREIEQLKEFSLLQSDLLDSGLSALQPGGHLVYSTCTIDPLENEEVLQKALNLDKTNIEIEKIPQEFVRFSDGQHLKTLPHLHHMDGSFCAIIKKK